MNEKQLPCFAISRLRMTIDGDGVTTLVTSTGCPLRCKWCLNPQSWDNSAKVRMMTAEQLYDRTRVDDLYFKATGGGITFGGGEPLLNAEFIREFRGICGDNWKLRAETCLNVPTENVRIVESCLDEWIIDIKDMNPDIYQRYTGKTNTAVLRNLEYLLERVGKERMLIRIPRIPEFNTEEDIKRSLEKLKNIGFVRFDIFDYVTE